MRKAFREFVALLEEKPFQPPWWLRGAHAQTIIASRSKRNDPPLRAPGRWEDVVLEGGARLRVLSRISDPGKPTLLVFHGMTGSTESGYMKGFSKRAEEEGWNSLLPNLYDVRPDPAPPKIFNAGTSREADQIVRELIRRHSLRSVFLVGASLGANIVLKLLGEWSVKAPPQVVAATALSPLCDLTTSWQMMERPHNKLYQIHFTRRLRRVVRPHQEALRKHLGIADPLRFRTIREFDQLITAPLNGNEDAFAYYRWASSSRVLGQIRRPCLILHAKDDPFLPWEPFVRPDARDNPDLHIHLSERGGHLAFRGKASRDAAPWWLEDRTMEFLRLASEVSPEAPAPQEAPDTGLAGDSIESRIPH